MLNALKLSELLAKNADPRLYPRIFVMSPNGTLMAYSTPVDIKELRDQAALISMAWREHSSTYSSSSANVQSPSQNPNSEADAQPRLETLTIETQHNNIIVRALQPSLLLILVGAVPPFRRTVFNITPEYEGDVRYPPTEDGTSTPQQTSNPSAATTDGAPEEFERFKKRTPSILSTMSTREKDVKRGALHIQRKKLDALTSFIRKDFDAKGFVMPDDSSFP
ncbi:hypothetical protein DM02DRAFT_615472 [Periconia macrospinosa]|uniref:Roadblock/LAMTOR2 domain-containing protein n=1 Tax=Periconia macrospinosa TaxID=97972 RepID=A0A2V1DM30_9PLEO|nr:hypothetical protein DM02DRAFT_615472 [Periconia macrospinosa]